MFYKNPVQDFPQVPAIINQGIQMLGNPVMTPHQRFPIVGKLIKNKPGNQCKSKGI